MKKISLWILKPQKTVLIENKAAKQHNLLSYYNYCPLSRRRSRQRARWQCWLARARARI